MRHITIGDLEAVRTQTMDLAEWVQMAKHMNACRQCQAAFYFLTGTGWKRIDLPGLSA